MSTPFSRSMRALQDDSYHLSLAGLLVAIVCLVTWATWFFLAQMTLYETGRIVSVTRDGTIVADFPLEALPRIRRGQPAFVFPQDTEGGSTGPFAAVVSDVNPQTDKNRVEVVLYPKTDMLALTIPKDRMTGQVEIEVDHVSPAGLMMRASGQFFDTLPVSLSPQRS